MKTYKIKIHKHTPKRYRKSKYLWERFDGAHNWWPEIPLVTDLTKKPKIQNLSVPLLAAKPYKGTWKPPKKPIKPHKLGIFENLKHHTIDKLRRKI